MNNEHFDNDNRQFIISYELLQLFRWLFENEQETLRNMIEQALNDGLEDRLNKASKSSDQELSDELQQSVVDYFSLLETFLYELVNEHEVKKVMQNNIIPEAAHIDITACDKNIISLSVAKATSSYNSKNADKETPKNILCRELLKRWKPSKKISLN